MAEPSRERMIFVACPWTPVGGGMFKVADYLIQSQRPEAVAPSQRARLVPLDTRGGGSAAASAWVLLTALWRLLWARLRGHLAGVHVNMAERLSLVRKCVVVHWACSLGVPVVLHLHAAQLHHGYAGFGRWAQALVRWTFRRPRQVLVLGEVSRAFVVQQLRVPSERVQVVVNGVPRQRWPRRSATELAGAPRRLLFLGNLSERKGVSVLLQALAASQCAQQGGVRLDVLGGGDIPHYQALAESLGVAGWVHFQGWADQDQAARFLASADALVLPSFDEGLPLVMLEALSHGLPVIATPVGEIAQSFRDGDNALLVPAGDALALAQAIDRLLQDEDLHQRLGRAGRRSYVQHHTINRFADAVASVHWQHFGCAARPLPGMQRGQHD